MACPDLNATPTETPNTDTDNINAAQKEEADEDAYARYLAEQEDYAYPGVDEDEADPLGLGFGLD